LLLRAKEEKEGGGGRKKGKGRKGKGGRGGDFAIRFRGCCIRSRLEAMASTERSGAKGKKGKGKKKEKKKKKEKRGESAGEGESTSRSFPISHTYGSDPHRMASGEGGMKRKKQRGKEKKKKKREEKKEKEYRTSFLRFSSFLRRSVIRENDWRGKKGRKKKKIGGEGEKDRKGTLQNLVTDVCCVERKKKEEKEKGRERGTKGSLLYTSLCKGQKRRRGGRGGG